jgi:hypothetical protein
VVRVCPVALFEDAPALERTLISPLNRKIVANHDKVCVSMPIAAISAKVHRPDFQNSRADVARHRRVP